MDFFLSENQYSRSQPSGKNHPARSHFIIQHPKKNDFEISLKSFVLQYLRPLPVADTSAAAPKLSLPPPELDSPDFWRAAHHYAETLHAALPFMVRLQRSSWLTQVPSSVQEFFEKELSRERIRLALLDTEGTLAIQTLENAKIPTLILKGMDVARRYYPERILRPMTDIDLLVPVDRYAQAIGALNQQGFRTVGQIYPGRFRVELARSSFHPVIEIHTQLLKTDTPQSISQLWIQSELAGFSDLSPSVRVLNEMDCLSYLVRHAAVQHLIESPIWLNDVHYLIQSRIRNHRPVAWDSFVQEMNHYQARSAGWFMLNLLKKEWNTSVPSNVLAALQPKAHTFRYRFLSQQSQLERWFPVSPRTWGWVFKARYYLKDSFVNAMLAFGERWILKVYLLLFNKS